MNAQVPRIIFISRSVRTEDRAGYDLPHEQPGDGDMEKASCFPRPHTPADGYVQNVRARKARQITSNASRDSFTRAGHIVVPVHERTLRVIAPRPDVELKD
jgi:hypothetical protein